MNSTSYIILGNSVVNPRQTDNFSTTVDPFYIGTGIGLIGGLLTAAVILHYLYTKKRHMSNSHMSNSHSVVIEKHTNVHDVIKTTIDLSV